MQVWEWYIGEVAQWVKFLPIGVRICVEIPNFSHDVHKPALSVFGHRQPIELLVLLALSLVTHPDSKNKAEGCDVTQWQSACLLCTAMEREGEGGSQQYKVLRYDLQPPTTACSQTHVRKKSGLAQFLASILYSCQEIMLGHAGAHPILELGRQRQTFLWSPQQVPGIQRETLSQRKRNQKAM